MPVNAKNQDKVVSRRWRHVPEILASERLDAASGWWESLVGDTVALATEAKATLPASLRPWSILFDVVDGGEDFRIKLVGAGVVRFAPKTSAGRSATELFGSAQKSRVVADLIEATTKRHPVFGVPGYDGGVEGVASAAHLVLPLSNASDEVVQVLVVVDFLRDAPSRGSEPAKHVKRRPGVGYILAAAMICLSFLTVSLYIYDLLRDLQRERLTNQSAHVQGTLGSALKGLEDSIADISDLVGDGYGRTPQDFHRLADVLLASHPGREAIRAAALAPELAFPRADLFRNLQKAHDLSDPVDAWPRNDDERGFPIVFVWPAPERVLGYDIWTDNARRAALLSSLSTGEVRASAPILLTQDKPDSAKAPVSSLLIAPIEMAVELATPTGTYRSPNAVIAMGVTLSAFVASTLADLEPDLQIAVFDFGPVEPVRSQDQQGLTMLAERSSEPVERSLEALGRTGDLSFLSFAGRRIGVWTAPNALFGRVLPEVVALGLFGLGLAIAATVGFALQRAATSQERLEKEVEERTARIRALNRELTAKAKQALTADASKSRLLSILSHELRTPLNGIIGFTELLQMRADKLSRQQQQDYLETVSDAGQHMNRVVQRFLEISQATPRVDNLDFTEIKLADVGSWLDSLLGPLAERYGVTLDVALEDAVDRTVYADEVALRQSLLNFVENGVKFTPAGGCVRVSAEPRGDDLVLLVTDSGVGMSADRIAALDEPLAGGGAPPINGPAGLGIGMSLSKSLLSLMSFEMTVASHPGEGTTVSIVIPASALGHDRRGAELIALPQAL